MKSIALVLVAWMLVAWMLAAPARADDLPPGQFGVVSGVRQGVGELGEVFGLGAMIGVHAGYHRSSTDRHWSLGVSWAVLWGFFTADDPGISDESLRLLELDFNLRARRLMGGGVPRFLVVSVGATLLRTNVPIPPSTDRTYFGPSLGLGVEQFLMGKYLLGFEWRYGLLGGGPGSLTGLVTFSFGR